MTAPRMHLIAPAGPCRPFFQVSGIKGADAMLDIVQSAVGHDFQVTCDEAIFQAIEDELQGGRTDDAARAKDIQEALVDNEVTAIVAVRGGAWLTRVLPLIDFTVLVRRQRPVALVGFSEITPLVNIVGSYRQGIGIYDMSPAFLPYGLRRQARSTSLAKGEGGEEAMTVPAETIVSEFSAFFADIAGLLTGRGSSRRIEAELVLGAVPHEMEATFVGGNLCVLTAMVGSIHRDCITPQGKWIVLEEINEKPERIDRFLATLTLAGFWQNCEGILLGDFHRHEAQLTEAVVRLLEYHLPRDRDIPVLKTGQVGHIWPMSPLPLHVPTKLTRQESNRYELTWDPAETTVAKGVRSH